MWVRGASPGTALHAIKASLSGAEYNQAIRAYLNAHGPLHRAGESGSSQVPRSHRDRSSPARGGTPRTLLLTAPAGACGDARGRLSSFRRGPPNPPDRPPPGRPAPRSPARHPPRAAAAPATAPLQPSPRRRFPGLEATASGAPPCSAPNPPPPRLHVGPVAPGFQPHRPADHGRAARGCACLPARAPEPAAGARRLQGPRGGSSWLPAGPAARPRGPLTAGPSARR